MNSFNYLLIFVLSLLVSLYILFDKEWWKAIFNNKNHSVLILFSLFVTTIFSYFIYPYIMPVLGGFFMASVFVVGRKFAVVEELREHPELEEINHDDIYPDPEIIIDPKAEQELRAEFDRKYFIDHTE